MTEQFIHLLTDDLKQKIDGFEPKVEASNIGKVLEAGDGIAQVSGLTEICSQELVEFEKIGRAHV